MSYYYARVFAQYRPRHLKIVGAVRELAKDLSATQLLMCGESHGVRENADVIYTLCRTFGIKQLAIERTARGSAQFVQSAIAGHPNFMLPNALVSLQASVLSLEMLKTIVVLLGEGCIEKVAYIDFDYTATSQVETLDEIKYMKRRETGIAQNITRLDTSVPTLVILGNYHTREQEDDVVGKSALQLVRQSRKATFLKYQYLTGDQYNAGRLMHFRKNPSVDEQVELRGYSMKQDTQNGFNLEIPKAHRILV